MRIGLVLPAVPGYSETFFRNKIRFLNETPGFTVVLFADRFSRNDSFDLCEVVYAHQFSTKQGMAFLQRMLWFMLSFIRYPGKVISLWQLNHRSGFSIKRNLTSVLSSAHLFSARLDWLHFGFGTMAIGREHVAKIIQAKMAVSFRGFDHYIYPLKHVDCYSLLFSVTDRFHVLSNGMKASLLRQLVKHDRVAVIHPAIDTSKFAFVSENTINLRKQIQLITVARLHWIKGLEYSLEALAELKNKEVDFHYTIIGEGEERERLIFAMHQLGLTDRVTFCGRLSHGETIKKLQQADIYLQYSIQEGFCNAVLEAQAMGLLCVVSDAEGLSENVLQEQTGWVVPRRKPYMLAKKIKEVIELDNDTRRNIQSEATKRVKEKFNLQRQCDEFIRFYLEKST